MSGKNKELKLIADASEEMKSVKSIADASEEMKSVKSITNARRKMKSIADASGKMKSIADASGKMKSIVDPSEMKSVEKPDRANRFYLLKASVIEADLSSKVNFDLGDIADMMYGYTKDGLDCLVKGAANLAKTQKRLVIEKMDFIEEVAKQSLDATIKNAKLQSFDKGVVSGHESGLAVVRTYIANLRQPRVRGSLHELLQLEHTLPKRLKYQNLKFRNYALRRLEMVFTLKISFHGFGILVEYIVVGSLNTTMKLFDCLPPLIDGDVDLVVLCCLTLACKMQNKRFHTTGFLLERGLIYNLDEVVAMELNLLRSLQWNTKKLTPFCFLQCLVHDLTTSCNMRLVYSVIVWTQASKYIQKSPFHPLTIQFLFFKRKEACSGLK
ncbi:hypothetical protein POM88_045056 [Heracleum sosnowskyi]|uniref:Cyclin N-terminal domain-containing protein n=1 Tax=Heracleum sosnowskyi TaxID=360622 RepID=A0AAD8H6P9_9APIA|nr:hypothetical protein POM88_045056 [Heracleum sosnowskyi]